MTALCALAILSYLLLCLADARTVADLGRTVLISTAMLLLLLGARVVA